MVTTKRALGLGFTVVVLLAATATGAAESLRYRLGDCGPSPRA